jgi:hypothetical protein
MKHGLPEYLSRKAVMKIFDCLPPTTWERLFDREDHNGIVKFRVKGDFPGRAYYDTNRMIQWLIRNGHYSVIEIKYLVSERPSIVRTHLMA